MVTSEPPSGVTLRFAQREVEATLADTPITVLQGARQVGKSTLAKTVTAGRAAKFLSLDATAQFNAASADPDAFVRQTTDLLVIDEVQRVPALIRAMKDAVEDDRRPGRFLITGSANLLKIPGTEESLAGRAETVVLYGFSQGELSGNREDFVDRVMAGDIANLLGRQGALVRRDYLELACAGSYPEPITRSGRRRNAWFDNYIQRIVTRDAEELSNLAHLDRLVAGIEMKSSGSQDTSDFRHLKLLRDKLGHRFRLGVVLYTGKAALPFGDRLIALPYSALWT